MGGLNDSGHAVGWSGTVRGTAVLHAAQWDGSSLQDLGGGEGDWSISRIFAINDNDVMVGDYAFNAGMLGTDTFDRLATLWQADGNQESLGTLPGYTTSSALAVNRDGTVVGWSGSADGSVSHAFIWDDGVMQPLGEPGGYADSSALAINALGQVVGWTRSSDGNLYHAVIWQRGQATDLNGLVPSGSGWVLNQAAGINILGQIAGTGVFNGQVSAYLLRPIFLTVVPQVFSGPVSIPVQGH
jgi:probable HAF family extracellular repeat protein